MDCFLSLRENALLQSVASDQLNWLLERAECRSFPADTCLYRPGDPIDHLYILLEGRIHLYTLQAGQQLELGIWEGGSLTGVLPFSRMKESVAYWQTLDPTTALTLHRDHFREMIQTQYELTEALVHQMTTRVRESTRQMQQNDKMMSLGRLSAGLAHELNNPVAAVVRSAASLKDQLRATPEQFKRVLALRLTDAQVDALNQWLFAHLQKKPTDPPLSLLQRSQREDDLLDWLDAQGVDDADSLSEPLVDFGFTATDLDAILNQVGGESTPAVLHWVVNTLATEKLVDDIAMASQRIAALTGAMKAYTHMDRGLGKENIRLREGIDNTLTLLNHKLRAKQIRPQVDLPDDLPLVEASPSELNQVWTNLIDNAIDAAPEGGQVQITGEVDRSFVQVRVIDNGVGIAADVRDQIFDPFFTTKPIGKGTGLGLDIAQGIIQRHNGNIYVDSEPGRTEFRVCLPISHQSPVGQSTVGSAN